ncbi:M56 family metallopeptidase [Streptomyces sp. NPDC127190]|uniref:M56 family metallopeptidase n=1 Tax=unclassified Streptomyces TaxID=2593676 RepID=UPI0036286252
MHLAVYLPLLLPLLAFPGARMLTEHCEPRLASWLSAGSALVLGAASTLSLALLASTWLVRSPLPAFLGHRPLGPAGQHLPARLPVAVAAAALLAVAAVGVLRLLVRRVRALAAATLDAACMPTRDGTVIVDDPAPDAFALPGLPGRIVVSTGMLRTLDRAEHEILLAHERAHLTGHHYLFVALAQLGAAANPLLRPLAHAVTYTLERWADEHAATATGDRRRVARAVGRAALATRHSRARGGLPPAALGLLGRRRNPLRGAGPVPRRVAALLAPPVTHRLLPALATALVLAAATCSVAEAAHDLHRLLEQLRALNG